MRNVELHIVDDEKGDRRFVWTDVPRQAQIEGMIATAHRRLGMTDAQKLAEANKTHVVRVNVELDVKDTHAALEGMEAIKETLGRFRQIRSVTAEVVTDDPPGL